jgi:REP element-mobilizing transposase RayT
MKRFPNVGNRQSVRLQRHDYGSPGGYFVTICTYNRECIFGEICDNQIVLNQAGQSVFASWEETPSRYPDIALDEFVIMPNHLHAIVLIDLVRLVEGAASSAPTTNLGRLIRAFKSVSAIAVNRLLGRRGRPLWQRNYYDSVIRNTGEIEKIRQYIGENRFHWHEDRYNPSFAKRRY